MTTEIQQYKCPSCGHQLGEVEYRNVCTKNERILEQLTAQRLYQQKTAHDKEIENLKEIHELEKEKQVKVRVEKQFKEEKMRIEIRHNQELVEKEKMIELVRHQASEQADQKIKLAVNQNEAKHLQTEKEYELKLKRLSEQIEKQQKTIEGIPSELRGTAGEFLLLEILEKEFRGDKFAAKKTGFAMADVIQTIVTESGETIPIPIVYDVKMGENVTKSDIIKAKNYMSIHKTPHSIIVTNDIKNQHYTEVREGILLVHPLAIIDIAQQIRKSIITSRILMKNNIGKDTKQSKLYEYFTGQEYTRSIQARLELKLNLDNLNRKEEDYLRTIRNKRNGYIENWFVLDNRNDGIIRDITQDNMDIEDNTELINDKFRVGEI